MSETKIIYANPKLPELLDLLGFTQNYRDDTPTGNWHNQYDENTTLYIYFNDAQNGNPKGRRCAKATIEDKPDKWITDTNQVDTMYPLLKEYKDRRDKLIELEGEQPTTPSNIKESNENQRATPPNKRLNTPIKTPQRRPREPQPTTREQTNLTLETIKQYINQDVTDQEAYIFLELCKSRGLNPFTGEVHLVKYRGSPATTIVGKDAFTKRAEANPAFDGYTAGITIKTKENEITQREGSAVYPDETLLGGWCKVYRKDHTHPSYAEVTLNEYIQTTRDGTPQRFWKEKPATMIRKVALVQALREAFPSDLGGLYDSSEQEQEAIDI